MKTYEVLEKALALIERKEDWGFAGDGRSNNPETEAPFCAVGAIGAIEPAVLSYRGIHPVEGALWDSASGEGPRTFNDTHTHAEVVELFQKAIASEKAKAGVLLEIPAECSETQRVYSEVAA